MYQRCCIVIGDFERISDHAVNIMESAQELHEKKLTFSAQARNELQVLIAAVSRIVDTAYQIFDKQDLNLTEDVEPLEEIVDELSKELKRRHINRLRSGECTIEMGFILTDLLPVWKELQITVRISASASRR